MFLEIMLVLMVLLLVTSCYVIWNLTTKTEMLEEVFSLETPLACHIEILSQHISKVQFETV